MFATQGRPGCGARWFIEIEIRPVRGDTRATCSYTAPLAEQRTVHRVHDRRSHRTADRSRGRPRVVVDHVELVRALEARERVVDLDLGAPDLGARRDLVHECELRGRVR